MPELPEVETTLRGIQPFVDGAILSKVEVRNASLRWPVPVKELQTLTGQQVNRSYRRAKYILLETSKGSMMLHLGMSGSVRVVDAALQEAPAKHDHIDLHFQQVLEDEGAHKEWIIRYHDPRRFGSLLFIDSKEQLEVDTHPLLEKLGPEPLSDSFNAEHLFKHSRKRNVAVKNFIMNGHVVVGVGNIYASECLFLAKVRPTRPAGKVTKAEYAKITDAIKQVLDKAIKVGGTTLRDFTGSDGKAGYFSQKLNVYDRGEKSCKECNFEIKRIIIGQRSSFYCPQCQK